MRLKRILPLTVLITSLISLRVYCQDPQQLLEQASKILAEGGASKNNPMGGLSTPWLVAGILFGTIGFSVFVYGKKTAKISPIIIGIILMIYPYFTKGILPLYLVGSGLLVSLFIFREK